MKVPVEDNPTDNHCEEGASLREEMKSCDQIEELRSSHVVSDLEERVMGKLLGKDAVQGKRSWYVLGD
jgi:hypothetical protein